MRKHTCPYSRRVRPLDEVVRNFANVRFWHLADNSTGPATVRFRTIADIAGFWSGTVCPLVTWTFRRAHCLDLRCRPIFSRSPMR
jgi:hypothetical protein